MTDTYVTLGKETLPATAATFADIDAWINLLSGLFDLLSQIFDFFAQLSGG